jgi:hypothetical protein
VYHAIVPAVNRETDASVVRELKTDSKDEALEDTNRTEAERTPGKRLEAREAPELAAFLKAPAESLDSILVF